jgi:hypothetical protein
LIVLLNDATSHQAVTNCQDSNAPARLRAGSDESA